MEAEITRNTSHSPATSPLWAQYYQRARELRRLGRGQNARIKLEIKRRRRRANIMIILSTAALVAVVGIFYVILGSSSAEPEGRARTAAAHTA
jgi:hypothetical protein